MPVTIDLHDFNRRCDDYDVRRAALAARAKALETAAKERLLARPAEAPAVLFDVLFDVMRVLAEIDVLQREGAALKREGAGLHVEFDAMKVLLGVTP